MCPDHLIVPPGGLTSNACARCINVAVDEERIARNPAARVPASRIEQPSRGYSRLTRSNGWPTRWGSGGERSCCSPPIRRCAGPSSSPFESADSTSSGGGSGSRRRSWSMAGSSRASRRRASPAGRFHPGISRLRGCRAPSPIPSRPGWARVHGSGRRACSPASLRRCGLATSGQARRPQGVSVREPPAHGRFPRLRPASSTGRTERRRGGRAARARSGGWKPGLTCCFSLVVPTGFEPVSPP